jgi:DNA-binding PadR family transcriptional regulator
MARKDVEREILLSFWKVHILHHAEETPVVGQWVMRELRGHGFEVSPGTLYPLLARMRDRGWLRAKVEPGGGLRARKEYSLTREGRAVLALLRRQVEELHREVVRGEEAELLSLPRADGQGGRVGRRLGRRGRRSSR